MLRGHHEPAGKAESPRFSYEQDARVAGQPSGRCERRGRIVDDQGGWPGERVGDGEARAAEAIDLSRREGKTERGRHAQRKRSGQNTDPSGTARRRREREKDRQRGCQEAGEASGQRPDEKTKDRGAGDRPSSASAGGDEGQD